jgi:glycosyltransferase involved in cell wall biosynthesis
VTDKNFPLTETQSGAEPQAVWKISAANPARILVIAPAYNEERFIGSVVLKLLRFPVTVVVVDDGSSDETAHIAAQAGAVVVRQPTNLGKAAALNAGFQKALEYDPDVIVTIDSDGQHLPEELIHVIEPILEQKADIVIGSRYLEKTSDVPAARVWGHRFFNLLNHAASGVPVTDSQSGYRAFSRRIYECGEIFHSNGFTVESEMQFIAHELGLSVVEVPITIRYTDKPKRSAFSQGLWVLNGIVKLVGQYRPLLFFSLAGLVLLAFGMGWGLYVIYRFNQVHQLAVGTALLSILCSILGVTCFSTGIILHSVRGLITDLLHVRTWSR